LEIPLEIDPNEYLVRIILHSFHYSERKKKVRPEAFLPTPSEVDEISVLRGQYTKVKFCKGHGIKLANLKTRVDNPCTFIGLFFIKDQEISEISDKCQAASCNSKASPLDDKDQLRSDLPIKIDDPGLPMHADIKYSLKVESDKPMNQLLKQDIIKAFCNLANDNRLFKDETLDSEEWNGDAITLLESEP
jgi:hypothetical protein